MEIRDYFKTGNVPVCTSDQARKCLKRLCDEIRIGKENAANTFFSIKNDMKKVFISWSNETVHTYRNGGRRGSSFIMQKRGCFKLNSFIAERCSFIIHNKQGTFRTMKFNNYYYQEICKMELAMYLHKYNEIYECEIIMIAIGVLFQYFTVFQKVITNNKTTYVW